jgi:hypothetical protein
MTDDPNLRIHLSPYVDWYATQDVACVWICDRHSEQRVKFEPPAEWGRHWSWNITEDGSGIYMKRDFA